MVIQNAQSIRQLPTECFHDPAIVGAITNAIMLLENVSNRRQALSALVDRLLDVAEIDAAVSAARMAPDLTPHHYVNNVDPWFKNALLLKIADRMLDRNNLSGALPVLDEATDGLNELSRYEPSDLPIDLPWFQLTTRYRRIGMLERVYHIWITVIAWARSIEESLAAPDPAWFQPEDGSRLLAGIVAEMLELGQYERAQATAAAIRHEPYRANALALLTGAPSPPAIITPAAEISAILARVGELLAQQRGVSADRANDLAHAGELLAEIGRDRLLRSGTPAAGLWERLRTELAALLNGLDGPGTGAVAPHERIRAGNALGLLGDPRFPLTDSEWQTSLATLASQFSANGVSYWRYVPAGTYLIGAWAEYDPYAGPMQRDQWSELAEISSFWLARLPVTVAQYRRFVIEGYRDDAYWTAHGLIWRREHSAAKTWDDNQGANLPAASVNWYEATAYCRWLNARYGAALPAEYIFRLPSEAEWEVAAAYDGTNQRRPHPWGDANLTVERAATAIWRLSSPAPVGLCPAGMAACGALDLIGGCREWSGSAEESYPKWATNLVNDHPLPQSVAPLSVPLRGVSWRESCAAPSNGARSASWPDTRLADTGFRLALAPRPG